MVAPKKPIVNQTQWIIDANGQLINIGANAAPHAYLPEYNNGTAGLFDASIDAIIKYYTSIGKINRLKNKLSRVYDTKGALVGDASFRGMLANAILEATAYNFTQTNGATTGQKGKLLNILQYLDARAAGLGADGSGGVASPTQFVNLTGRNQAWELFSDITAQLTGKRPNKKEFEDYYKELTDYEKKFVTRVKESGARKTSTADQANPQRFTLKYIVKQIDLADPNLKGVSNTYLQRIEQLLEDNGVDDYFTSKTKLKLLKGLLNQRLTEDDVIDTIRKRSMAVYSQWRDEMAENPELSFSDIIKPFAEQYANILELNGPVNIAEVAKMAVTGDRKMTAFEFEQALRNDPRWNKTKQANVEAGNLAASFARAFGVNL